jgi:predicted Zn-dependent peptidase
MNMAALRRLPLLLLLALLPLPAGAAEKPQINVQEFTLPNGMRWLLFERHDSPTVVGGWVAHVGSVNEREGITGISHLFEHMMFKGTRVIGTKDIDADLRIIDEQEKVRAEMREEMKVMRERQRKGEIDDIAKPESQTPRYRELDKRFDELVQKQRAVQIKDHLSQIYTKNGAEGLNAGTSEDWTIYMVRLPANRIELWSWLESDRLMNPVFREFYSERDVVYEERRMRTESTPLGKYDEAFNALFWEASPYKWPVVGWPSDVSSITKAQADGYFGTYYAPNNLTGVLVGDFDALKVRPLLERYFGRIPRGKTEVPEVVTSEPAQIAEKRFNAEAETSPTVRIWWHGVPFVSKDRTVVDVLTDLLSGRTGRLYKGLVTGRQVANEISGSVDLKKYEGSIQVEGTVKEGKDPAAVEQAIYEELEKLKDGAGLGRRAAEGEEPGQGQRLPAPVVPVLDRHPAHDLRRSRRLALHQHRTRRRSTASPPPTSSARPRSTSPRRTAPSASSCARVATPRPTTIRTWPPCPRPRRPWPASRSHASRRRRTRPSSAKAWPRWKRPRARFRRR